MELADIERVIAQANSSANAEDQRQANSMLDGLRQAPDSWSWGMRLFFESTQPVARFFGLSLTRAQMALGADRAPGLEARRQVRSSLMTWVQQVLSTPVAAPRPAGVNNGGIGGSGSSPQSSGGARSSSPETYLLSNVTAVLTLCIKWDFPEDWRTAFTELLAVGAVKPEGTEMVLAVLENFDTDVVVFNESRTREEWTHNTAIKDCMRGDGINAAVVQFLLQRAVVLREQRPELSNKCLEVLSLFVSWVDINLILEQQTMALLYQALADSALWAGACLCLIEVVKKGMPAPLKMELLCTTRVLEALCTTCAGAVSEDLGEHLAPLVDALFIEVLDVWVACEKGDAEVLPLVPQVADALRCCMTCVLPLFRQSNFDVAVCLVPSLNRFAQLLKSQAKVTQSSAQAALRTAFDAKQYLQEYLASVFAQLQFDDDFDFDAQDEDDCEEIEGKKEIRKLYVAAARVYPEDCLQLMSASLSALPTPLSSAPFPPTEAALKLVLAFGDCGVQNASHVKEGLFPQLLKALHDSDIGSHAHAQVRLNYFELSARYARQSTVESIGRVAHVLIGAHGMRCADAQVRCRAAYFFLKVVECAGENASKLLPIVGSFADMLLPEAGQPAILNEPSELYLLEAVGLMTSQALKEPGTTAAPQLLIDMVGMVVKQIGALLCHPQRVQYSKEVGNSVAHKVASLGSLARGHRPPALGEAGVAAQVFIQAGEAVASVMDDAVVATHALVRPKCMMFLHRVVPILGAHVLPIAGRCLATYLASATTVDVDESITVLNQLVEQFSTGAMDVVDVFLGPIVDKLGALYASAGADGATETQVASDRFNMQKQCISFIQHVTASPCIGVLVSPRNAARLPSVLDTIMNALSGGGNGSCIASVPLRRSGLATLVSLTKAWGPAATSPAAGAVDPAVKATLTKVVLEQALPSILTFCLTESNARDALTLSLYADVGSLFFTVGTYHGNASFIAYLGGTMLPALSWPPEAIATLMTNQYAVDQGCNLSDFREKFKSMLKTFRR